MSLGSQEHAILATLRPRLVSGFVGSRGIDQGVRRPAGLNSPATRSSLGFILSSWVSSHLPLSLTLEYERGISAVPRDRRRRFRGTRRHKLEVVKDLHQLKKLSQGPIRRPAGLNSPATPFSAGFVMREVQTGRHKPEGGTKQRLTKSADNSAPVYFPNCDVTAKIERPFILIGRS
jgi:hypothetical protein